MTCEVVTMNEAYPNGELGNGIFTDLQELDIPWKEESINDKLDMLYYSRSGDKSVSRLVSKRLNTDGYLPSLDRAALASAIFSYYSVKWSKLYDTLSFEYNPIENYRMEEEETINGSNSNTTTDTGTIDRDASNSRTDSGTIEHDGTVSDIVNKVYGFNSSSASNSDTSTDTVDSTETHDLTFSETVDETETHNLSYGTEGESETTRGLTRAGNIGVTTSQQMIESERALWDWNYFNVIFSDIDSFCCLDIYDIGGCI